MPTTMSPPPPPLFRAFLLFSAFFFSLTGAGTVGVNWGRVANNLPSPTQVVQLLQTHGIDQIKLYDADPTILRALAGTGIKVVVTLPNEQLLSAATSPAFSHSWVQTNVAAHFPATTIHAISVGNEVFVDPNNLTTSLVPAMQNIHSALLRLNLDGPIKVSSPIALTALANSYPSSSGEFQPELAEKVMKPMLDLLKKSNSYLMVNVYPFFAYVANSNVISLDYALFRPNPGVVDPTSGLRYYSLLDAQLDAVFSATKALGYDEVRVVVSETGWPSKGDKAETGANAENAAAYNGNLVRRVLSGNAGTPMVPNADVDVYLFALFNENEKVGPTSERNYGLFYPDERNVYEVEFRLTGRMVTRRAAVAPARKGGATWCVAEVEVGRERLQAALDYACGEGGADCEHIQPGAACYDPNTLLAHASFAFNSYYQRKGRLAGTCDFQGAAHVVATEPKFGKCEFPTGY